MSAPTPAPTRMGLGGCLVLPACWLVIGAILWAGAHGLQGWVVGGFIALIAVGLFLARVEGWPDDR